MCPSTPTNVLFEIITSTNHMCNNARISYKKNKAYIHIYCRNVANHMTSTIVDKYYNKGYINHLFAFIMNQI